MRPDVSVVIPTYNRRSMVQQAVESCFDGNDGIDVEVVVVDDGSTDGTREYLEGIEDDRVRPIFQEHQGAQVARNRGQEAARGKTIKHLDDDDYLCKDALERQYRYLKQENVEVSYGDVYVIDERNRDGERIVRRFGPSRTLFSGLTTERMDRTPFAFLFPRGTVDDIRWDESLDFLQDFAFMHEVAGQHVTCGKVDGPPVAVHRAHKGFRVTDVRNQADLGDRFDFKCQRVYQACLNLLKQADDPEQESVYREQGALGIWNQAHKVAPFDFSILQKWYKRIRGLDPSFVPPRHHRLLEWGDRWLTPLATERLINPLRRYRLR